MARETPRPSRGIEQNDDATRRVSILFPKEDEIPETIENDRLMEDYMTRAQVYVEKGIPYKLRDGEVVTVTAENYHEIIMTTEEEDMRERIFQTTCQGLVAEQVIKDHQRYIDQVQARNEELTEQVASLVERQEESEERLSQTREELLEALRDLRGGRSSRSVEGTPTVEGFGGHRKALDHPKRLSDGADPSFDYWKTAMTHKMEKEAGNYPLPVDRTNYIISRCEGKTAKQLEPYIRKGTYRDNPEGLMDFLETLFHDPMRRERAETDFYRLYMKKEHTFQEFYAKFIQLAADAEIDEANLKRELSKRITFRLKEAVAQQSSDPTVGYQDLKTVIQRVAYILEGATQNNNKERKPGVKSRKETGGSTADSAKPAAKATLGNERLQQLSREGKCFSCEGKGHLSRDCPYSKKGQVSQMKTDPDKDEKPKKKKVAFQVPDQSSDDEEESENE